MISGQVAEKHESGLWPLSHFATDMGNLGLSELVVIFIVALLVIGPRRLPEVARGLGEAYRAFQDALKGGNKGERP